jgi:hypothetical protein
MVRAHLGPLNNQPLTIYFVGGFFFGASLVPGFYQKGWWEFSPFFTFPKIIFLTSDLNVGSCELHRY